MKRKFNMPGFKRCPNCKTTDYETTTMGIILGRDMNRITCSCGWRGKGYELIEPENIEMDLLKKDYVAPVDIFEAELKALAWESRRSARQEYFQATTQREYTYGGAYPETYTSKPMSPLVDTLMSMMNKDLNTAFNVCFLNKYDNEKNHLGWHADDFPGMRADQPIGVVSFGAAREIWVKPKGYSGEIPKEWRYLLAPGSLFLMPAGFQETHLHRIPKHDRPCGWRISLTFRSFQ